MNAENDREIASRPASRLKAFALLAAIAVAAIGLLSLIGWALDVHAFKAPFGTGVAIKTNTAIALLSCGLSLLLLLPPEIGRFRRRAGRALAILVLVIGALSTSEHLVGWDLHIDQLLFTEPPGAFGAIAPNRPGLPASMSFVLLGGGAAGVGPTA